MARCCSPRGPKKGGSFLRCFPALRALLRESATGTSPQHAWTPADPSGEAMAAVAATSQHPTCRRHARAPGGLPRG